MVNEDVSAFKPHCPECKVPFSTPRERVMPDRVVEYRCPACSCQIPLLVPGSTQGQACAECLAEPAPLETVSGVDATGLLNLMMCGACGCLLGRYWGLLKL